jgi:hypothetical protein
MPHAPATNMFGVVSRVSRQSGESTDSNVQRDSNVHGGIFDLSRDMP